MILLTGGAGFIGSAILRELNSQGTREIAVVDRLGKAQKWRNLRGRSFEDFVHRDNLLPWLEEHARRLSAIIHMGACSSTTETDADYILQNNVDLSKRLFRLATRNKIPMIYASSASVYGDGSRGFDDRDPRHLTGEFLPLNPYGFSKALFDQWALTQHEHPPAWVGLRFFNVYGPQEYHKGGQASVVLHGFRQLESEGTLRLFKSHREGYADGEQKRDFIYVRDAARIACHALVQSSRVTSGIYNVGSGVARTFADLGRAVCRASGNEPIRIQYIDMPLALRTQYQYYTEAPLTALREGLKYDAPMTALESGVEDYVAGYLRTGRMYYD